MLQVVEILLQVTRPAPLAAFVALLLRAVLAAASASRLRADSESQVLAALLWWLERLPFAHVSSLYALLFGGVRPLLGQEVPEDAGAALPEDTVAIVVADRSFLGRFGGVADCLGVEGPHLLERIDQLAAQLVGLQLRRFQV